MRPISAPEALFCAAGTYPRPRSTTSSTSRRPWSFRVAMWRSGLCTVTPAGGTMSPAVTVPGPCLRRYIVAGSSSSELTTSSLRFRMMSVTSSFTPGTVVNSWRTPSTRMRGDGRARDGRQQGPPERVAEGVTEARLERLDDEPRPGVVDRLLGEGGTLGDQHFWCSFRCSGIRYLTPNGGTGAAMSTAPVGRATWSRTRRSAAPARACRSAPARAAGGRRCAASRGRPAASRGPDGPRTTPSRPRRAACSATCRGCR